MQRLLKRLKAAFTPAKVNDLWDDDDGTDSKHKANSSSKADDPDYDSMDSDRSDVAGIKGASIANANIKAWYGAAVPFFTKDRLRVVHEEMQRTKGQEKATVYFPDMNGVRLKHSWDLTEVDRLDSRGEAEGWELVPWRSSIVYEQHKRFEVDKRTIREYMYQNLAIAILMIQRDRFTKQLLYPPVTRSPEGTERDFQSVRDHWNSNVQCEVLMKWLTSKSHLIVNKVVAFANASMSAKSYSSVRPDRPTKSMYQHALMLTLKDHFGAMEGFAQDPAYRDTDVTDLKEHGIQVVDDPQGFLEADENTAVISIAPDAPIKQVLCDVTRPAVLIWARVENKEQKNVTDPDSIRVFKIMKEEYDYWRFPFGLDEYFLPDLGVYTKKHPGALKETSKL